MWAGTIYCRGNRQQRPCLREVVWQVCCIVLLHMHGLGVQSASLVYILVVQTKFPPWFSFGAALALNACANSVSVRGCMHVNSMLRFTRLNFQLCRMLNTGMPSPRLQIHSLLLQGPCLYWFSTTPTPAPCTHVTES